MSALAADAADAHAAADDADAAAGLDAAVDAALAAFRAAGAEGQAAARRTALREIAIAHDEPALLRSTATEALALVALVDGRRAATEVATLDAGAIARAVADLVGEARSAPRDEAHALSAGQRATVARGPREADLDAMAERTRELLAFRARAAPTTMVEEAVVAHTRLVSRTRTTGGTDLACDLGWYDAWAMATARDGQRVSSFAYAEGSTESLADAPLAQHAGIGDMLVACGRQIDALPFGARAEGELVLEPMAVQDLLEWLLEQLGDVQLLAGTSLYRDAVGTAIASPAFTLASRFDAPGVAALSADAFPTPEVTPVLAGRLQTLTPTLYGSRRTGLPHVPIASAGWQLAPGDADRDALVAGVRRGALVGRLSMGQPAANGDFSGVVKNAFAIRDGARGGALAETMVTGNVAAMLRSIVAVGRDRLDLGRWLLPGLRIEGLVFS